VKASFLSGHGELEAIRYADLPDPVPGPGQARIRVLAGALNHLDIFVRAGFPGLSLSFPHVMGSDGAGIVDSVGPGVAQVKEGDEVVLNPGIHCGSCEFCLRGEHSLCATFHLLGEHVWGTFAEYVVVPAPAAYPKPAGLSWEEAAAFPLTFLTAWRMLVTKAQARPGESLLIIGIGGGVSLAALAIAKMLGLTVGVTSGSPDKLRRAGGLGADFGIDHGKDDIAGETRRMTGKRGVDIVLDSVGKATWKQSIDSLVRGGRLLTCGATTGPNPEEDIVRIFWNQLTVMGSTMGTHAEFSDLLRVVAAGRIRPVVDSVFPLSRAREAHRRLVEKKQFGKIVLRPD